MVPLSPATTRRVDLLFPESERAEATQLLIEHCGNNLPFLEALGPVELERFRFAALKVSEGNLKALKEAILIAQMDWLDLLMAAGFGSDITAHSRWLPNE